MIKFTIEAYKKDKRCKKGEKLLKTEEIEATNINEAEAQAIIKYPENNIRTEVHQTMITKFNLMSGKPYQEHYNTPLCCSPASETYWSM